ncbi:MULTISPECIES: FmdB family zinc ribbon protein [unclassified Modestobacter]
MPTYQYVCTNPEVKHEFERVQSFSEPAVTTCPECEAPVRKVYGSVGVVFKGSGFYRTDSRSDSGSKSGSAGAGKDGGSSSSTSSSPSTSTPKSGDSSSSSSSGGSAGSGSKAAS